MRSLDLVQPFINAKNITVVRNLTTETWIKGDETHLKEVLMGNLFKNAIEAITKDGRLTVSSTKTKKEVMLIISDTGKGISKDEPPHIFDLFYTSKGEIQNYGLGLSYCQNVINKHGGKIKYPE